jgi:WD40 repeat protein
MLAALALALAPQVADPELESYLAHVAAAHSALRLGDARGLRRWLEGAPPARRGFEWDWLAAESDASLACAELEQPALAFALAPDGASAFVARGDGAVVSVGLADGATRLRTAGHARSALALDMDAGGERVLTSAQDGSVTIWDAASGTALVHFTGHDQPVGGAAFSPEGELVATSSYRRDPARGVVGLVLLWDSSTGELVRRIEAGVKPIVDLRFSPDGRTLAAATWGFVVYLWDLQAGGDAPRVLAMPDEGLYNAVDDVAFSPDGKSVAAASKDHTARVWDVATGEPRFTLRGHDNHVTAVAWSPDGERIATSGADGTLRLWSAADGTPRGVLRGHRARVDDLAFARDGGLWSASSDGTLRRWDARHDGYGGVERRTSAACYVAVLSPDGERLATASYDGRIQLWETRGWSETGAIQAHPADKSCHALAWSGDGARLYSGSHDGTVAVWDAATQAELARWPQQGSVQWLALAPAGDVLAVALNSGVRLWDTAAGEKLGEVARLGSATHDLCFSPDGALLALSHRDRSVRVVDVASLREVRRIDGTADTSAVAFSPDGRWLAYSVGGVVRLVDARTWEARAPIEASENAMVRLAWSPDGTRLAGASHRVALLAPLDGAALLTLRPHAESGWHLAWTPDGTRLVTTAMDGSFVVTDRRALRAR